MSSRHKNGRKMTRDRTSLRNPKGYTKHIVEMIRSAVEADASFEAFGPSWKFAQSYLLDNLLMKYIDEDTDPADLRRSRAIVKWLGVEDRNKRTTERIWNTETLFKGVGYSTRVLEFASSIIQKIIGDTPPDDLLLGGSFSGGATTSLPRGIGTLQRKFTGTRDVTLSCFRRFAVANFVGWRTLAPEIWKPRVVKGNVLFTVPKTSVIDRVAAKEPDLNIFCQKAVGDFLRHRLRSRARIDLNDQSINQRLALKGSIDGTLATIDLSSASDSLSAGLVTRLLPHAWVQLLEDLRSPYTQIDDVSHENEMFSSMGNGFTFELESLVFYALAKATCYLAGVKGRVSVYGDDLIVPSAAAKVFICVLNWSGFKVNEDKTFIDGPFRESCGKHYHGGLDVSPFYIRGRFQTVSDVILTLNQLRAWIIRVNGDLGLPGTPRFLTNTWGALACWYIPRALWGGYSLESRTQLVSSGPQQCELLATTRRCAKAEDKLQLELYLERLSGSGEGA